MNALRGLFLLLLMPMLAQAADRPNLIIMMTDDQRQDAMSCAGHAVLKTPNMDRIANEGARFKHMFVTNSLCAPSRATLMTGLYSHSHGVIDNTGLTVPMSIPFVSDHLRKAGYEVAFCGKSHAKGAYRDREWDYYFGFQGQGNYFKASIAEGAKSKDQPYTGWMDDIVTDKAVEWLQKKREKPFCLFLFFKAPHRSWNPPTRHKDLYSDVTIPKPNTFNDDRAKKSMAFAKADNIIGKFPDVKDYESFARDYFRCITGVDDNVGKVLDALTASKTLDDTAIFYTSDNGFFVGEWQAFDKRFMHEVSARVPLLVRYPKMVKAGSQPAEMATNVDIAPTLLSLAGLPIPAEMQGRSLVPVLKGEASDWRKDWLYEYYEYPGPHSVRKHRGVRTDQYKLIHYYDSPEEFELYDLKADPDERVNLAAQPEQAARIKELLARIEVLRRETKDAK